MGVGDVDDGKNALGCAERVAIASVTCAAD
jgi:hypothetical protein